MPDKQIPEETPYTTGDIDFTYDYGVYLRAIIHELKEINNGITLMLKVFEA